jgi:hypothetical protein
LKTVKTLDEAHRAQCVNYIKTTGLQLFTCLDYMPSLLLNSGNPHPEIKNMANRL